LVVSATTIRTKNAIADATKKNTPMVKKGSTLAVGPWVHTPKGLQGEGFLPRTIPPG